MLWTQSQLHLKASSDHVITLRHRARHTNHTGYDNCALPLWLWRHMAVFFFVWEEYVEWVVSHLLMTSLELCRSPRTPSEYTQGGVSTSLWVVLWFVFFKTRNQVINTSLTQSAWHTTSTTKYCCMEIQHMRNSHEVTQTSDIYYQVTLPLCCLPVEQVNEDGQIWPPTPQTTPGFGPKPIHQ